MAHQDTFIVDCPRCNAKVAALQTGLAQNGGWNEENREPWGEMLLVGKCPKCSTLIAGESKQVDFENFNADDDRWTDVVRVYPKPPRAFTSYRIPRVVKDSLVEADRSLQANANIAACVMLGRALEALCRDILEPKDQAEGDADGPPKSKRRPLMLGKGIEKLREKKIIDDRLYNWSQQLQAFRNLAAHPEDISISREDTEDLQSFVNAIVEYIYDLADRYDEFKARVDRRASRKKS
jgi:hypothetical protein